LKKHALKDCFLIKGSGKKDGLLKYGFECPTTIDNIISTIVNGFTSSVCLTCSEEMLKEYQKLE